VEHAGAGGQREGRVTARRRQVVRIGIVGTGKMGKSHAHAFRVLKGVELEACFDVDLARAQAFAAEQGVRRAVTRLEDLLESCDAVSVVTPDRFHAPISLQVLAAGKHLLCEKPLAVTLAEARQVAAAARQAALRGVIHMVSFSYRRAAAVEKASELVRAGRLGDLRHVHGFYLQTWLSAPVWGHWTEDLWLWRLQTAAGSGGVLGDVGCHLLDLATCVAGAADAVRCDLRTYPKVTRDGQPATSWQGRELDANDSAVIQLELSGGAVGMIQATRWATGHKNHLRLEVHGTRGALLIDLDQGENLLQACLGKDVSACVWRPMELKPAPTIYERFVRAIRTGRQAQPDVLRGAEVQAYLDACERSARSGKWESVAPIGVNGWPDARGSGTSRGGESRRRAPAPRAPRRARS
jgi:predicted dehydrogenase